MSDKKQIKILWTEKTTAIVSVIALIVTLLIQMYTMIRFDSLSLANTKINNYQMIHEWYLPVAGDINEFYTVSSNDNFNPVDEGRIRSYIKTITSRLVGFNSIIKLSDLNVNDVKAIYKESIIVYLNQIFDLNNMPLFHKAVQLSKNNIIQINNDFECIKNYQLPDPIP